MKRKFILLSTSVIFLSLPIDGDISVKAGSIISAPLPPPRAPSSPAQTEDSLFLAQAVQSLDSVTNAARSVVGEATKKMRGGKGNPVNNAVDSILDNTKRARKADKAATSRSRKTASKRETRASHSKKTTETAPPPARRYSRKGEQQHRTGEPPRTRNGQYYKQTHGSANCICVEGYYCVGPLGGHYCWTSGGNKRYLKRF